MKWLALDCSTDTASVAVGENQCLGSRQQVGVRTHSQKLLHMVNELLSEQQWYPESLDAIIFGRGPGSFTGLRVACSVVQGMAFAHDLPVYPVSGLQSIAHHLRLKGEKAPILAAVDARMNELYWAIYSGKTMVLAEEQVSHAQQISLTDNRFVIAGVGVEAYLPQLGEEIRQRIIQVLTIYPNLEAMVDLVLNKHIEPVTAIQALPVYIRNQVTQGASGG
ncbi:tRNA (adenosine(37)-N6)-threonylcarbamoyltransferase complex dimerization subunit type 1 TsaB [Legionella sp. W05-934-2]|uniref:tRNA (adenosine(37)-N6)-threonylcarbamoyltransferase complex dimerization subunit type 1 TsaB n=1 Tax=Legionella sp. W05-934-2 TaxID=1198649 RepID=UPI003462947E